MKVACGLDFGTESVRALLVDLRGRELAAVAVRYAHGQLVEKLPGSDRRLPASYAFQHPRDWMEAAGRAVRKALRQSGVKPVEVVGVGVDFTSCTMLPCTAEGVPLCELPRFASEPMAWPKLWKHHGAQAQADRINAVARERGESFLERYGGGIGLEWFFPKVLETIERAPRVAAAAELWLEAGDWLVWQLVGGGADCLVRSTCQAGYKGMWSAEDGFPSEEFLGAVHPRLARVVVEKMPGRLLAPGMAAGGLSALAAKQLGLRQGTAVSAAIIDAHAGVPGAGASEPGTLVMVLGTSACHMLNAHAERRVPGVAGVVKDGILPGFYGYETGQAAVGDAFDWLDRITGRGGLGALGKLAAKLPTGADGVRCVDWFGGCRTPLMDGGLRGMFSGLALHHEPAHLYRALLEATACGLRWIVELLREGGVPVERFVATGGLPHHSPEAMQVYADVLGEYVGVHPSQHGPALGSAILGALAAGEFASAGDAVEAMAVPRTGGARVFRPRRGSRVAGDALYAEYRRLADFFSGR